MIAAYIRVSSKRMQGDGESVPAQIAAAEEYAKNIGEPIELYQDKLSGSRPDRADYVRLKQDIISGKVTKLYCRDEKRIGRNAIEALTFFAILIEHKITLIVNGISKDLSNSSEWFVSSMMSLNAEKELKDIKSVTRDVKAFQINQGRKTYGCLYGYKGVVVGYGKNSRVKRKWEKDKKQADVVKMVFGWYLKERLSPFQIALRLNDAGYKPIRAKHWSHSQIAKMLRQEAYAGLCRDKHGELIKSLIYKAIITRKTYDRVQVLYPTETTERYGRLPAHPASGLLICGKCGEKYHYHANSGKYKQESYVHDNAIRCNAPNRCVNYETINEMFWDAYANMIADKPNDIYAFYKKTTDEKYALKAIERLSETITEQESKIANFTKAIGMGLDIETATAEINRLRKDIAEIKSKRSEMEKAISKEKRKLQDIVEAYAVSKASEYYRASPKDKHEMMSRILESATLREGRIYFVFAGGYTFNMSYDLRVRMRTVQKRLDRGWDVTLPEEVVEYIKAETERRKKRDKLLEEE
jgi:hypothetical protein